MKRKYTLPELELVSFAINSAVANVGLPDLSIIGNPFDDSSETTDEMD